METKINDLRIYKNNRNGFEVRFKPLKLGVYVAITIGLLLFIVDYILFKGAYSYGEFAFLLHKPIYLLGFIALKVAIIYTIYIATYTFMSNFIVKLDKENLSKFSAPIPKLKGNKSIKRNEIESYKLEKISSTTRASQISYTRMTQTYYNLRIKLKGGNEFTFFYSLLQDETNLIKRLLDEHLNL